MKQHVHGISVDAERSGALQLLVTVAAGQHADPQCTLAPGCQQIPNAIPHHNAVAQGQHSGCGLPQQICQAKAWLSWHRRRSKLPSWAADEASSAGEKFACDCLWWQWQYGLLFCEDAAADHRRRAMEQC